MKKVSLSIMAASIAAVSVFTSCKKENPVPPVPDPGPAPEKTCVVHKTFDANGKLTEEYVYSGDKLSKINSYDDAGVNVDSMTVVSYDAAGNIAKVEYTDAQGNGYYSQSYEYHASGTLGKIRINAEGQEEVVLSFEYNGTDPEKPSRVRASIDFFGTPMEVAYLDYTYDSKGNNTQAVTYAINSNGSGFEKSSTVTYTYDEKKNPNQALAPIFLSPAYAGPNNITKETTIDHADGNSETFMQTSYEYNADNYPSKITRTDDKGMTEITTVEYSCK